MPVSLPVGESPMVILDDVELQEPLQSSRLVSARNSDGEAPAHLLAMHLQQQHFGGSGLNVSSHAGAVPHAFGSLSRKVVNNQAPRSYQRLSTFRPMHGHGHSDLVRECLEEGANGGPTYETIEPHHLSK